MPMPLHHGTNDASVRVDYCRGHSPQLQSKRLIASAHVASSFAHAALVLFLTDCTWHELIMQKID